MVVIHSSGAGADKLEVVSYHNGGAYALHFGEGGAPCRTLFFQGDDATELRAGYDAREEAQPDALCRDIWLGLADPHL